MCEVCHVTENISHLLYDCPDAANIWDTLHQWLIDCANIDANFAKKAILLGDKENDPVINTTILLTKYELYKKKWKNNYLNINYLQLLFQRQMKIDIYIGTVNNTLPKAFGKWAPLHNFLTTL